MNGRIPQAFINELVERTSIIDVINQYIPLKKRGNSHVACCPFHHEKSPSFNVSDKKNLYHCFGCGAGGNVISFLMAYHNENFVSTLERLAEFHGLELPRSEKEKRLSEQHGHLKTLLQAINQHYQQKLNSNQEALSYLINRGLSHDTINTFQLGYAINDWHDLEKAFREQKKALVESGMLIQKDDGKCYDRYRRRITFPIQNEKGDIIGFGGRSISPEDKPKYLNSPETPVFHKSYELYGLHLAKAHDIEHFIVVEGYMDVIALHNAGIAGGVATLGTATSEHHIKKLLRLKSHVVFCFDGDEAGQKAAYTAMTLTLKHLRDDSHVQFLSLPDKHDPDSFIKANSKSAFLAQMKQAPDIIQCLLTTLRQEIDLGHTAGRAKLISQARSLYQAIPSISYQTILKDKLSLLSRMNLDGVLDKNDVPNDTPARTAQKRVMKGPQKTPSLWQKALALLIQNPEHYQALKASFPLSDFTGDAANILKALMPQLEIGGNAANLLELNRDKPYFPILEKLATLPLLTPEAGILDELKGAFSMLNQQNVKNTIDNLLKKAQAKTITDDERRQLQHLIQQNSQIKHNNNA